VLYDPVEQGIPDQEFNWSDYDVLILDYDLRSEQGNGLDILDANRGNQSFPATVMLTGAGNEEVTVRAMKAGIHDYLRKNKLNLERLYEAIISAHTARREEQVRLSALDAARKVAKLQANEIFAQYKARFRQLHIQQEARLETKKRKLAEEMDKHQKLLKNLKSERLRIEQEKVKAAAEVKKLATLKEQHPQKKDSEQHKALKLKLKEAREKLQQLNQGEAQTLEVYAEAEDALAKSNWQLAKEEALSEQIKQDLDNFRLDLDLGTSDADAEPVTEDISADEEGFNALLDEISSQLGGEDEPDET